MYRKVRLAYFQDGQSKRAIARRFGISRDSVDKIIVYSVPPGYRRVAPIKRPKLDGFTDHIDQWLQEDDGRPKKQRHTAKRVFERLRDEHSFAGGYGRATPSLRLQAPTTKLAGTGSCGCTVLGGAQFL